MIEHFKNIFRRIFSNEETVIFFLIILSTLILFSLFIEVLTPFIISIVVAYLLVGLQKKIETYGVTQPVSTIIAFSVFIIVGAAMFTWLIPLLYVQLQSSGIQSTITVLLYIILFPILVYFFLFDRKNIIEGCLRIIPGDRAMLSQVWSEMDVQLSNYVRGKVLEIFIVGIAAAILFASFGLNYGALLAVLVGLSVLIPYVGAFSITIPIVIIGLLQFGLGTQFYLLIGLYLLLQFLDGNLLVPIIFSEAVKLHPIVIILAVFIFGSLFGFWGVFFSIPLATFIKAVWNAWPGLS